MKLLAHLNGLCLCASVVVLADDTNSWHQYPTCAQSYLSLYFPQPCENPPAYNYTYPDQIKNACICSDQGFLDNISGAINSNCGCTVLQETAEIFTSNCDLTSTPAVFNATQIVAAGTGGEPVCPNTDPGFWTLEHKLEVIIPVVVGGPPAFIAIWDILFRIFGIPDRFRPWPHIRTCFCGHRRPRDGGQV